jgi:hypothetical protein
VVTQQLDIYVGANPYAVAVANTTNQEATITITRGANAVANGVVAAGSVKVFPLPWVNELAKGTGPTALVVDGAYRLRSTQPVTVYQYNPLNADVTNDASLMLPVNTWTGNYLVAAWQYWSGYPGFYSVTASQDNTKVTLKAPKGGVPTQAGGGVDGQGNGVVMMNEGDVLQVMTGNGGDETGAIVTADKPVQVVGGHDCTQVPIGTAACDHLEESMFPIEALAKEYIVVPPVQVPNDQLEKAIRVRIIASEDNTTLTFDPDQPVGKLLAKAGDFVEIPNTTAKFVVKSDKKILVAEYMVGQQRELRDQRPGDDHRGADGPVPLELPVLRADRLAGELRRYHRAGRQRDDGRRGAGQQLQGDRCDRVLAGPREAQQRGRRLAHGGVRQEGRDHGVRGGELRELLVPGRARSGRDPAVSSRRRGRGRWRGSSGRGSWGARATGWSSW